MTAAEFIEAERSFKTMGFKRVQGGQIQQVPPDPRPSFANRAVGFDIHLLGTYGPPDWRSQFENRLIDTDDVWAHWRRSRQTSGEELHL